ncbi:nucleoside monophosphate kinase [Candidatus Campbellbacteria bacterium]|nr:MAG: nucleoside monophosphate kinase [Candidatus Campbellbacteria bacterium]
MQYNTIVILGKPGSGKGTQAKLLSDNVGFPVFSASGQLKALAASHPDLGEEILNDMDHGILVPHWIISYLWISAVVDLGHDKGIIFDGAVRKMEEATLFNEVMQYLKRPYVVVYLTIPDEELRTRIKERARVEDRADDDETIITKRLEEYQNNTQGSLDFFKRQGTLLEVEGMGTVEEVHERIIKALSNQ